MINNGLNILKKHRFQTVVMILLVCLCLYILGVAFVAKNTSDDAKKKYMETYGNMTLYRTGEYLSDASYYNYYDENGRVNFDKLHLFLEDLGKEKDFSFYSLSSQVLEVTSQKMPEQFLYGYEDGYSDEAVNDYLGETMYATKSIQVSSSFFDENNIKISEGVIFSSDDYCLNDENRIPVLLGSTYKGVLKINDSFKAYYMGEKFDFYVIGFVADGAFFYDSSDNKMKSCERYIIVPALYSDRCDRFARIVLLNQVNGYINSSLGYEETGEAFKKIIKDHGLENWNIYFVYNGALGRENIFEKYSAMTSEVSKQFRIIVIIILIFAAAANIIALCSMLRENFQTFGVEMICGASRKSINKESFIALGLIMAIGDVLASMGLLIFGYTLKSVLVVQYAMISILIITSVACAVYIKEMKLDTYIGGKE